MQWARNALGTFELGAVGSLQERPLSCLVGLEFLN